VVISGVSSSLSCSGALTSLTGNVEGEAHPVPISPDAPYLQRDSAIAGAGFSSPGPAPHNPWARVLPGKGE
jgi:hypothetical protein